MISYECYTDGAYSSVRNQGGIGVVFLRNGEKVFEKSQGYKDTTNNQMEIVATLLVLKSFKSIILFYPFKMYILKFICRQN